MLILYPIECTCIKWPFLIVSDGRYLYISHLIASVTVVLYNLVFDIRQFYSMYIFIIWIRDCYIYYNWQYFLYKKYDYHQVLFNYQSFIRKVWCGILVGYSEYGIYLTTIYCARDILRVYIPILVNNLINEIESILSLIKSNKFYEEHRVIIIFSI